MGVIQLNKSLFLSFERTVAQRTNDYSDLYYNLVKYTSGEAQELVKSCNYDDPKSAYKKALKLLSDTYGNENIVANHYLKVRRMEAYRQ